MIDYEALIAAGLESGASLEEIAAGVSKALNQAKQKQEQKEEPTSREWILTHFENVFDKHYKDGHLTLSDIAALLTLSVAQDTDEGLKMDEKELDKFFDFAEEYVGNALTSYNLTKAVGGTLDKVHAQVITVGDSLKEILRAGTDRKCEDKSKCTCGKHEAKPQPMSERLKKLTDDEKIEKWLRELFK